MKKLLKTLTLLLVVILSESQAFAQIKDGEATVLQGSTTTVSIGSAYQATLNRATNITYTWTAGSSAISIQSKTNKTCTIKGVSVGTTRLNYQCSYRIDGYSRSMNFYYDITVKSNTISVTRIEMTPSSATMEIGETLQLSASAYPTNATNRSLNWTTEDYSVASVSSNGLVTARGVGRVWIWARATDGSGAGNYCVVDVKEPVKVTSIELSETEKTLTVGETFELTATVLPEDANNKSLAWSSDNEDIAMVSDGVVTAINPGECNIKCESSDGSNVSAICHITVQEPEQVWLSVIIPNGRFAINVTDMESMKLQITPDEGYSINSVTIDGDALEHDNGCIVLPSLSHNSTLNVVFIENTSTGIESMSGEETTTKVSVKNHHVYVDGAVSGQYIYVYDMNGVLVKATVDRTFELAKAGVYVLKIGNKTYKLAIQ